ncbi:histidine--tRNA ligase [Candidatus Woesearchaeota archaeon]|nr:histidine--tRNA ligase [Candidatus Woesearchaeota archaeon]
MKLALSKGTKDYLPEEQIVRNQIKEKLKRVFEKYGFSPLETPIIEMRDILSSKYAGGAEILKEMFVLTDQGKRKLGLRYDLTVPLARVIGMNPNLRFPFKRYEMGRVFRDGPIKLGRLREFWQCDVDIVGSDNPYFDAELLCLACEVLNTLGLDAYLEVNNRKILNGILEDAGIPAAKAEEVILSLDKLKKIGEAGVRAELLEKKVDKKYFKKLFSFFEDSSLETLNRLLKSEVGLQGVAELKQVLAYVDKINPSADIRFVPGLARGLAYYTGMVFEGFAKESKVTSSICGGGRYDYMVGQFLGKGSVPTTGFTVGLDAIYAAVKSEQPKKTVVDVYIAPIKTFDECLPVLSKLRAKNIRCDIDTKQRSPSKNLDYANKEGIPYVLIVGKKELDSKVIKLKDMKSGEESELALDKAIVAIKSQLAKSL